MVINMKGIIGKIWKNQTATGKDYWVLSVGGNNYSIWDKQYVPNYRCLALSFTCFGSQEYVSYATAVNLGMPTAPILKFVLLFSKAIE